MISRKKVLLIKQPKELIFLMDNINVLHGHGSFVDNETIKIEKDGNSDFEIIKP